MLCFVVRFYIDFQFIFLVSDYPFLVLAYELVLNASVHFDGAFEAAERLVVNKLARERERERETMHLFVWERTNVLN